MRTYTLRGRAEGPVRELVTNKSHSRTSLSQIENSLGPKIGKPQRTRRQRISTSSGPSLCRKAAITLRSILSSGGQRCCPMGIRADARLGRLVSCSHICGTGGLIAAAHLPA